MSERPTDTQPARAAAAHDLGRDARAWDRNAGAGHQSVADRAANFRQGAPFLVERATLYDPEPLDPPAAAHDRYEPPPRRLLPAALTLLGIVVVVGLSAGVLFIRNADVVRVTDDSDRPEQLSDRGRTRGEAAAPPGAQPNSDTVAYDLRRRPNDTIVGAWRRTGPSEAEQRRSDGPSAAPKRRPLPWRLSAAPPEVPPEPVTRGPPSASPSVAVAPPRYDAPEPRRRVADGDILDGTGGQPPDKTASIPAGKHSPDGEGERPAPSVVARVGRASEPLEALGPPIEIPLDKLALPLRRPDSTELDDAEERHASSARSRRARLLRLQRQLRREQRHARKREHEGREWVPEALYGNRFLGIERYLP